MSIALHLWSEGSKPFEWRQLLSVKWILPNIILIADSIWVRHIAWADFPISIVIGHVAAILSIIAFPYIVPFLRDKSDMPQWNFTTRMFVRIVVCHVALTILYFGVTILYFGTCELFGLHDSGKLFYIITFVLYYTLGNLLLMCLAPGNDRKYDETYSQNWLNVVLVILLIQLLPYIAVLYSYCVKIIYSHELPNKTVCSLTTGMMFGIILIRFALYPYLKKKNFITIILNNLHLVVLPLLVLMTVSVSRLFINYGITASRLYMATLNIWFYAVCIGLQLCRQRRINWILYSFFAILIITSCQPLNYFRISIMVRCNDIKHIVEKYRTDSDKGEFTYKEFKAMADTMDVADRKRIHDDIEYLQDYDQETLKSIGYVDDNKWYQQEEEDPLELIKKGLRR